MSYSSIVDMAQSTTLQNRIAAAAAKEGIANPLLWAIDHVWLVVAEPGWAEAWNYAKDTATLDVNPDTGARPGVISDNMILGAVQAVRTRTAA